MSVLDGISFEGEGGGFSLLPTPIPPLPPTTPAVLALVVDIQGRRLPVPT